MVSTYFGPAYFDEVYYLKGGLYENKMLEWKPRAQWLVKTFDMTMGVLEIGAGEGCLLQSLASLGIEAVGIDMSRYGALFSKHLHRVLGSDTSLPFSDGAFGFCVGFDIWEHNYEEDIPTLVEEVFRVLRPGSMCFFNVALEGETNAVVDENHLTLENRSWWSQAYRARFEVVEIKEGCPTLTSKPAQFVLRRTAS